MRIKHSGQMPMPGNPKHGAGDYHAGQAKRALASCASGRQTVQPYPVSVTVRRKRVAPPVSV
jgi:hypothetical protein